MNGTVDRLAGGSTASSVTCSTISRNRLKKKANAALLLAENLAGEQIHQMVSTDVTASLM